jgi:hypothetical protein
VLGVNRKLGDTWKMLAWQFSRTMGERKEDAHQGAAGDASRHGDTPVHLPATRKQNSNTGTEDEPELISGGKQAR